MVWSCAVVALLYICRVTYFERFAWHVIYLTAAYPSFPRLFLRGVVGKQGAVRIEHGGFGLKLTACYKSKMCHSTARQRPVNLWARRWASFSSRLIYISKWHIYIPAEYEVTFCFTPVLTFNSKDNGQEGKAILRPVLMYFNAQPS